MAGEGDGGNAGGSGNNSGGENSGGNSGEGTRGQDGRHSGDGRGNDDRNSREGGRNDDLGVSREDANRLLNVDGRGRAGNGGNSDDSETENEGSPDAVEAKKWKALSRKNENELNKLREQLKKHEDAQKSDSERLQGDRDGWKERAVTAESGLRKWEIADEVAPDHATRAQIKAVARRLHGKDDEELETDAKELFAVLVPAPSGNSNSGGGGKKESPVAGKPRERLRGGSDPSDSDDGEMDTRKLAARIPRAR